MPNQPVITFDDTKLIRDSEGHSLTAYPDPATKNDPIKKGHPWTISYGITGAWVKPGVVITQAESELRFMELIKVFCKDLDACLTVELGKNQYIAVLSLLWNIGKGNFAKSTLLKKLNAKDFAAAALEFVKWNKANGAVMNGLTTRRAKEAALFSTPSQAPKLSKSLTAPAVINFEQFTQTTCPVTDETNLPKK